MVAWIPQPTLWPHVRFHFTQPIGYLCSFEKIWSQPACNRHPVLHNLLQRKIVGDPHGMLGIFHQSWSWEILDLCICSPVAPLFELWIIPYVMSCTYSDSRWELLTVLSLQSFQWLYYIVPLYATLNYTKYCYFPLVPRGNRTIRWSLYYAPGRKLAYEPYQHFSPLTHFQGGVKITQLKQSDLDLSDHLNLWLFSFMA